MTKAELIEQLITTVGPVLVLVVATLGAVVTKALVAYLKAATGAKGLEVLEKNAVATATAARKIVDDLKDPKTKGDWTEAAAATVKADVVRDTLSLSEPAIRALRAAGYRDEAIRAMADRGVESAVQRRKKEGDDHGG
jgi:Holliday junction resolvasome RuvABC DNA-binding subunit